MIKTVIAGIPKSPYLINAKTFQVFLTLIKYSLSNRTMTDLISQEMYETATLFMSKVLDLAYGDVSEAKYFAILFTNYDFFGMNICMRIAWVITINNSILKLL